MAGNSKKSMWGNEDKETLDVLNSANLGGNWLNLAAGDGRYNNLLLKKADFVIAADIDEFALKKLETNTPKENIQRLRILVFDVTKKFPFNANKFDGILCTGTLHLFNKEILQTIFSEITRVLNPSGRIIIDFATDIKRITKDGKQIHIVENEPRYTMKEAIELLKTAFKDYKSEIHEYNVPKETVKNKNGEYEFECKYILLTASKP